MTTTTKVKKASLSTSALVAQIATKNKISVRQAKTIVKSTFEAIKTSVKKGESVRVADFGTFNCVAKKSRKGFNPKTREKITIKAKKVAKFVPGKSFKAAVKSAR